MPFRKRNKPSDDEDYIDEKRKEDHEEAAFSKIRKNQFKEKLCRLFPFRLSSRAMGKLSDLTIPRKLRKHVIGAYVRTYRVNLSEACVQDLEAYRSLNEFFRREIKSHLRPIAHHADVVSPCDGTIVYHGPINDGIIRQVKGMCFSLKELFAAGEGDDVSDLEYGRGLMNDPVNNEMCACVIYLAPGDYHRFHSPAHLNIRHLVHVTGELISVKPTLLPWLPRLFVINERVVLESSYKHGFISTVAVGATNVGSIRIYNQPDLRTNLWKSGVGKCYKKDVGIGMKKGEALGEFNFGSTLVVVYEAPKSNKRFGRVGHTIKYGAQLSAP